MNEITYDVRIYKTDIYKGKNATTYRARWKAGPKQWRESFRLRAQADSFLAELRSAAKKGEAFSGRTGRPVSWQRTQNEVTWYAFAHDVAYALTQATPAMYTSEKGKPEAAALRRALFRWAFNAKQRDSPPDDVARVLRWVAVTPRPSRRCRIRRLPAGFLTSRRPGWTGSVPRPTSPGGTG